MAMIDLSTITDAELQAIHEGDLSILTTGKGMQRNGWTIGETSSASTRVATLEDVRNSVAHEQRQRFPGRYRAKVTRMRCSFS